MDELPRHRRLWWIVGWGMVLFILYATLSPVKDVPDVPLNDKYEHGLAFFGLTGWFGGLVTRRRYWLVGALMSALGALIELLQGAMGWGRDMDIHDWYADSYGVLIALAVLYACIPRRHGSWLRWFETLTGFK